MADSRQRTQDQPRSVRGVVGFADQDPRRGEKRAVAARCAMWALCLGVFACVLQTAATATPTWAYFHNPDGECVCVLFFLVCCSLCVCELLNNLTCLFPMGC